MQKEDRIVKLLENAVGLKKIEGLEGAIGQAEKMQLRRNISKRSLAEATQEHFAFEKCSG